MLEQSAFLRDCLLYTSLPKLKQQLADTKGIFKGKERKALTEQIQRTEKKIAENLDKLPDVLKEDGYPDVQAFMATYRKAEAVVEQYNRDLAAWERQVREKQKQMCIRDSCVAI